MCAVAQAAEVQHHDGYCYWAWLWLMELGQTAIRAVVCARSARGTVGAKHETPEQQLNPAALLTAGFQQQLSAVLNAEDVEHNIGEALKKLSGGRQPGRVICTGHR